MMGACNFENEAEGKTAQEAFDDVVGEARYMMGHGGYTGTIGEKNEFKMITVPEGIGLDDFLQLELENEDSPYYDKWGPAGAIDLGDGKFLFYGSASS